MPRREQVDISYQQILEPDGSVFSVQSLDFALGCCDAITTASMLEKYLIHVRRITWSLVQPVCDAHGIRFTLLGSPIALLRFAPPQPIHDEGHEELRLQIVGGVLVQRKELRSGTFSFIVSRIDDRIQVTLQLAGFCPILLGSRHPSLFNRLLYQFTQARIHRVTCVNYLMGLYRDVTGTQPGARIKEVFFHEGREI